MPDPDNPLNLTERRGWTGLHTTDQYPGAWPNGTRVRKIKSDPGDQHSDGTLATVIGSMGHPSLDQVIYCVEWDPLPRVAIAVIGSRIERVP